MHKKHMFLRVFSKITIFACVFCAISAWAETTTCDINYTPVTGNSIQNGTPTPTNPVEIESIGTKVGNKYAVQIAINNGGGVVDLGTLDWSRYTTGQGYTYRTDSIVDRKGGNVFIYLKGYEHSTGAVTSMADKTFAGGAITSAFFIRDDNYVDKTSFKQAMSGKMLYYQRTTDETWVAPTLKTVYLDEPLRKVGDYADVLDYKNSTITRNVGVKVLDGTEDWKLHSINQYGIANFYTHIPTVEGKTYMCSHFQQQTSVISVTTTEGFLVGGSSTFYIRRYSSTASTPEELKAFLAQQYANGTPVTIYYPLATPVVEQIENWSCTPPITDIKIATTKFVDDEFAAAEAKLAATVQTIEDVVSRTITQTGQIQVLQDTKQTRPDENCPANMKCLLVQDEDGTPHWYPIIEP